MLLVEPFVISGSARKEKNAVFLTGESLSGARMNCSDLAGAVSRMGLVELTARPWLISVLFEWLGAEGQSAV